MTHRFNCQSDGWDPRAPPLLTWYLNGEQQQSKPPPKRGRRVMAPREDFKDRPSTHPNSTFSLKARKWDRELVCVTSNPRTGQSYNATVTLNIQCESQVFFNSKQHYVTFSPIIFPFLSLVQPEIDPPSQSPLQ